MLVQWLFNACSMVGERLSPCVVSSVFCFEHECGRGCCFCFVSHDDLFLVVENRVYLGGCFSWKAWQFFATAWQIFATAWQKIRMPCAEVRQGGCLAVFRDVFSTMKTQTERFFVLKKGKQSDILQGKTERKDRKRRFVNKK